jgi:hypothetical protein
MLTQAQPDSPAQNSQTLAGTQPGQSPTTALPFDFVPTVWTVVNAERTGFAETPAGPFLTAIRHLAEDCARATGGVAEEFAVAFPKVRANNDAQKNAPTILDVNGRPASAESKIIQL